MTYLDISATDTTYNNLTSLAEYNETMNFLIGTTDKNIDINDNEYFRIRAYSVNEKR